MRDELADHYTYLAITDSSITSFCRTDFSSYNSFANHIHNELLAKRSDNITKFIYPIIKEVVEIFGMSTEEATKYVRAYFLDKLWERYYKAVRMVRNHFKMFLSDNTNKTYLSH